MSCTSLSFVLGTQYVQEELARGFPAAAQHTDMATAVIYALRRATASGAPRVCMLTPYIGAVHAQNLRFLAEHSVEVVGSMNLSLETDSEVTRINKPARRRMHINAYKEREVGTHTHTHTLARI